MKISIALILTFLALTAGVAAGVIRARMWPWEGVFTSEDASRQPAVDTADSLMGPRVVVDEAVHDFGVMDNSASGSHDYNFTNVGTAPLQLEELSTSCSCAVSEIEEGSIVPGDSGKVTVEWTGKGRIGEFRHTATIGTNDPNRERVVLTVEGRLTAAVHSYPSELEFSRIATGEGATGTVRVLGFLPKPMEITGFELANPESTDLFEISYEEMTPEQAKEIEEEAYCGYEVTVRVKSGLPLGRFRQTIRLKTNLEESPTLEVPVGGSVKAQLSIAGAGWNDRRGVLTLGTFGTGEGIARKLLILLAGERGEEVEFKVIETVPDLLHVDFGPTSEAADGSVKQTILNISVPQGSRPARYLGPAEDQLGRITIQTSHPDTPKIKILVRFAIRG